MYVVLTYLWAERHLGLTDAKLKPLLCADESTFRVFRDQEHGVLWVTQKKVDSIINAVRSKYVSEQKILYCHPDDIFFRTTRPMDMSCTLWVLYSPACS